MNFLYCFDENYNSQAFSSIISLLDSTSESINIFIIHNTSTLEQYIPIKIINHKMLRNLKIFKFNENNINFPNIPNTHVSEATYYRLFLENYIIEDLETVIYLDPDVVCLNDPISNLRNEIIKLKESDNLVSARTEFVKSDFEDQYLREYEMPWDRLGIDNEYFNAGVMIINYKKWKKENLTQALLKKLKEVEKRIIMWDQDVLNSYLNGKYNHLNKIFNYRDNDFIYDNEELKDEFQDIIFFHYAGSGKPWKTNSAFHETSKMYHENYRKVHSNYFHIEHANIRNSYRNLILNLRNKSLFKIDYPKRYLFEFIKSLIIEIVKKRGVTK